jgi:hypothetical protein
MSNRADARDYEYDVCLSFAGEHRPYVEKVTHELKEHGVRVFYDLDETPNSGERTSPNTSTTSIAVHHASA